MERLDPLEAAEIDDPVKALDPDCYRKEIHKINDRNGQ
jgi:hypothetical protein